MDDTRVATTDGIVEVFQPHLRQVYTTEPAMNPDRNVPFLQGVDLPQITPLVAGSLDTPVGLEELRTALSMILRGKVPGGVGIPPEFYQVFSVTIMQGLLEVLLEACKSGIMPPSMREGEICMFLKPGGNGSDPSCQ
ncbi:hypothetical protein NDU88_008363 [Pleurodeles waltl]|uniref:Uncharacterized protein n=1 Tax=Pleurodeles waltl TaxID=8319 RepID=A0AAV7PPI7_PLEWA|nr:hypothetical protein NDU88_008363 [Pleurodeles waltl]